MRANCGRLVVGLVLLGLFAAASGIGNGTVRPKHGGRIALQVCLVEGELDAFRGILDTAVILPAGRAFFAQIDPSEMATLKERKSLGISLLSTPRFEVDDGERVFMPGHESYQPPWIFGGKAVSHLMGRSRYVGLSCELIPTIRDGGFALACDISLRSLLGKTDEYTEERVPNGVFTEATEFMFTALIDKGATAVFCLPAGEGETKYVAVLVTPSVVDGTAPVSQNRSGGR